MAEKPADKPSETPKKAKPAKQGLDLNALSGFDFGPNWADENAKSGRPKNYDSFGGGKGGKVRRGAVAAEAVRHAIVDQVDVLAVFIQLDVTVIQIGVVKARPAAAEKVAAIVAVKVVAVTPQHLPTLNRRSKSTSIHRMKLSKL